MRHELGEASIGTGARYIELNPQSNGRNLGAGAVSWEKNIIEAERNESVIALIEPRRLLGQCLIMALYAVDQSNTFKVYDSTSDWKRSAEAAATSLVIISAPNLSEDLSPAIKSEMAEFKGCTPAVRFAILSDKESPKHVLNAIQNGAQGYIPTSLSVEVIVQVLQLMKHGGTFVPATSLVTMAGDPAASTLLQPEENPIFTSQRQLMVARALRKGTPNKVIAYQLNMCESTVKVHVRNIMKKLKAKNRTEVALLTTHMFPDDAED